MASPRGRKNYRYDALTRFPAWTHVDVLYWAEDWEKIRDCLLGEREVKLKGEYYLPRMNAQDPKEYNDYLDRAVFYNMVGRTVNGMVGTVYRRSPKFAGIPKKFDDKLKTITRNGISILQATKAATRETIAMGRYGFLVDIPASGGVPYIAPYVAENILDWVTEMQGDREVLTRVMLREINMKDTGIGQIRRYSYTYRALVIEDGVYKQKVWHTKELSDDIHIRDPDEIHAPSRNGVPLSFIPFQFLGAETITPDIDRSPIIDIVALNISHYRSYAQLEHGRFFTGLPIYYAPSTGGDDDAEYVIGPNVVWQTAVGEKPGIIEFNGAGLKYLENACSQKETQISALGGRLLGGQDRSTAESDNQTALKDKNERSVLLNVVTAMDEGMTRVLNWWLWWQNVENADARVEHNTDWLLDGLGARELRAVYLMYKEGAVPVTVLYEYLRKAEAIPDYIDVDQFKKLLAAEDEFPNNPDIKARRMGYDSAQHRTSYLQTNREIRLAEAIAEHTQGVTEEDLGIQQQLADTKQQEADVKQQQADTAKKQAELAAKNPPVPAQASALRNATGKSVSPKKPAAAAAQKPPQK